MFCAASRRSYNFSRRMGIFDALGRIWNGWIIAARQDFRGRKGLVAFGYVALISAVGLLLTVRSLPPQHPWLLPVLAGLAIWSRWWDYRRNTDFLVFACVLVGFGRSDAVVGYFTAHASVYVFSRVISWYSQQRPWYRALFNLGNGVLTFFLAGTIMSAARRLGVGEAWAIGAGVVEVFLLDAAIYYLVRGLTSDFRLRDAWMDFRAESPSDFAQLGLGAVLGLAVRSAEWAFIGVLFVHILFLEALLAERLQDESRRDPMLGIANRRFLLERLSVLLRQSEQHRSPIAIFLLDLDYFKQINDRYGHGAGDVALQRVCSELRRELRDVDLLGRYGGEELCCVCPGLDANASGRMAQHLGEAVRRVQVGDCALSVSIGIYWCGGYDVPPPSEAVHRADVALYQAKLAGRDRWVWWDASMPPFPIRGPSAAS
jgi:diguanylate cyclase (GGDEF)-like protein